MEENVIVIRQIFCSIFHLMAPTVCFYQLPFPVCLEKKEQELTLCGAEDDHNSAHLVIAKVHGVLPVRGELPRGEVDLEAVVSPCSELERTVLFVERKPRDVNLAC